MAIITIEPMAIRLLSEGARGARRANRQHGAKMSRGSLFPLLPLLLLLPLAHAVRIVTPFRTAPARMAASLPPVDPALKLVLRAAGDRGKALLSTETVDPALKLVLRAAGDRGKADLSSLRALAGLIGMDDGLRALEKELGINEDASDADIQARALVLVHPGLIRTPVLGHQGDLISTVLTLSLPLPLSLTQQRLLLEPFRKPAGRALPGESRLLGLVVAVLAVEAAQFLLVASVAWLVSAASLAASPPACLAMAPPPLRAAAARVLSAGAVGLQSRGATRPLRLAAQLLLGDRLARQLAARKSLLPRRRTSLLPRRRAARHAAAAALALPLLAGEHSQ